MTFRLPAFMVKNYAADMITDPATQILERNTSTISTAEKRSLIDRRVGSLIEWDATAIDSGFSYNLGAVPAESLNRFVVPSGHTLSGETWNLFSDSVPAFSSATLRGSVTPANNGVIDVAFSAAAAAQYWAFQAPTSLAETFQMAGLWIGVYSQLSASANVKPDFENGWVSDIDSSEFAGGALVSELAPARRRFSLKVGKVDPSSDDYTTLDLVQREGRARPFWYWPPDDIDAGPFYVRLTSEPKRELDFAIPSTKTTYQFDFEMTEEKT